MAIKGTIGQTVSVEATLSYNTTLIDKRNPAAVAGVIKTVDVYVNGSVPNTTKLKFFRVNGSNYDVVYTQTITGLTMPAVNTITLITPFKVQIGDLIGWWTGISGSGGVTGYASGAGTGYHYQTGDITTSTAIASWTGGSQTLYIVANIMSIPAGGFGFGNPWMFLKDAWEKHDKLWKPKGLILPKDLGFSY